MGHHIVFERVKERAPGSCPHGAGLSGRCQRSLCDGNRGEHEVDGLRRQGLSFTRTSSALSPFGTMLPASPILCRYDTALEIAVENPVENRNKAVENLI